MRRVSVSSWTIASTSSKDVTVSCCDPARAARTLMVSPTVFVHYTAILMKHGFRCLHAEEAVSERGSNGIQ